MHELRPFQAEALAALESPQHVLCVAPTGSGKSLIYERMVSQGEYRMLLVTPLVALARQQEARLRELGTPVALGTGSMSKGPPHGRTGAWIISPETLDQEPRQNALAQWKPNFLVVDECHCLWEWGDHFRPAFRRIPGLIREHRISRSLWLTATLPPDARREMRESLPRPFVELGSFDVPPRLKLKVIRAPWIERPGLLLSQLRGMDGPGIVFVVTRASTTRVARLIEALGKKVAHYHAGMAHEERLSVEALVGSRAVDVIVATSAFGMGMDYSFLNWAILWQAPTSLLNLTQAIGRVGRSSRSCAEAIVFWDDDDFQLLEWAALSSPRKRQDLLDVAGFVRAECCRRFALRRYFNSDAGREPCGFCDICL